MSINVGLGRVEVREDSAMVEVFMLGGDGVWSKL